MENDIRKMLKVIRDGQRLCEIKRSCPEVPNEEKDEKMNFLTEADYLMSRVEKKKINEETSDDDSDGDEIKEFVISKTDKQFGDLRTSQEETLKKTIGEMIELGDKALVYYPDDKDLVLSGKIKALNIAFQFRYNDPSGIGCYLWANGLQLSDSNLRAVGKIGDAYKNWKQTLLQGGDIIDKLDKEAKRK